MKIVKNWKKTLVAILAAITLTGSLAAPVMAHGHHNRFNSGQCGGSYCTSRNKTNCDGYYCAYHHKTHRKKSICKNYCSKHRTTHKNGKRHYSRHH